MYLPSLEMSLFLSIDKANLDSVWKATSKITKTSNYCNPLTLPSLYTERIILSKIPVKKTCALRYITIHFINNNLKRSNIKNNRLNQCTRDFTFQSTKSLIWFVLYSVQIFRYFTFKPRMILRLRILHHHYLLPIVLCSKPWFLFLVIEE